MLRRFLSDTRGNYLLMTAAAIVPILGGMALAVDYTEMSRQRQLTLNALDAAGIATARRVIEGATDDELTAYAKDFFQANMNGAANASLTVVLPKNNAGGGTLKLTADLKYKPYFLPAFSALMGDENATSEVQFDAVSEIRLKNTLEVALVLDNSGSMDYKGSGSGKKRLDLLKDAAKDLVDKLSEQAAQMKQVAKPVQFGLVPFAFSVNVGPQYANASWMDTEGRSPIHHENFDWTTMKSGVKRVEYSGGVYVKKGAGWLDKENQVITRFTMYDDLKILKKTKKVKTGTQVTCARKRWGRCVRWKTENVFKTVKTFKPFVTWDGCVEARPAPYNRTDAAPVSSNPSTLFVPMFAADETDKRDDYNRSAYGDYWLDLTTTSSNYARQRYMPKYFLEAPKGTKAAKPGTGPNISCTTKPITPLTDTSEKEGRKAIRKAIDDMDAGGGTNVPEGIAWGWRVVSGGLPFDQGRPDSEKGNDKVVIVLTDGASTYYTPQSIGYNDLAKNRSTYSAYGYAGRNQPGESKSRLFMNTSVSSSNYSNSNYSAALNEHVLGTCSNAKSAGVIVMTVALDLSSADSGQAKQIATLRNCASDSRFRRGSNGQPAKLFWNATSGDLSDVFNEIADELSNLRIVG